MKAIIMAGGAGQRLRPLTCTLPKPMVPVMNVPVMEYTLRLLRAHGITKVSVTLQYLPRSVQSYFGDGSDLGMQIDYVVEDSPLGTAGSVLAAGANQERTLVISGDALTDLDLSALIKYHTEKGGSATIVLKKVEVPLEYGVAVTQKGDRIERFIEKPDWSLALSDCANTGIYILEPNAWQGFEQGKKLDFAYDIFPAMLKAGKDIYGYLTEDYWCDIGNIDQYMAAHRDLFDGRCKLPLPHANQIDHIWVEEGARLDHGCVVKGPCYIGKGAHIKTGAAVEAYSVIGSGCTIQEGASLRRSILWNNVEVGAYSELRAAVVCSDVTIGRHTSLFESAVAAEGARIGSRATLRSGVRVWPQKSLPEGCSATADWMWSPASEALFTGCEVCGGRNELPSELACRLGRAVATASGEHARIGIASDGSALAVQSKQAVIAGAMEAGGDIYDLERTVLPVLRFGAQSLGLSAALYLAQRGDHLTIRLLDGKGNDAGKGAVRSVQTAFEQGGNRSDMENLGVLAMRSSMEHLYCASVIAGQRASILRQKEGAAFCVAQGMPLDLLRMLFGACSWQVIPAENPREADRSARKSGGIGLGIVENSLELYCGGEALRGEGLELMLANVDLLCGERTILTDTLTGDAMNLLARRFGARVERLPQRELQAAFKEQDTLLSSMRRDPYATALGMAARLCELSMGLEQVFAELPLPKRSENTVAVAFKDIGRVFRMVTEEQGGARVDLTEGVRISKGNGWVNILPDESGRRMRIIGQSFSEEYAQSLADFYTKRVEKLRS